MDRDIGNFPEYIARKGDGPMDDDEMESVVKEALSDAFQYVENELGAERAKASDYYHGNPFGNEEEGRSKVVLTEVRDGILGVLPSILRVVHGPEHPVEFVPKRADQVAQAEQKTDYIRYVYEEDNSGFLLSHSTLKDGLLKKIGILKWGMDEAPEPVTQTYKGLSRAEMEVVAESAELGNLRQVGEDSFDVEATVMAPSGKLWIMPVPPDDFAWNREARSLADAKVIVHRMRLTKGELRTMGISEDLLEEYGSPISNSADTPEEIARRSAFTSGFGRDAFMGEANQRIQYCEAYLRLDIRGTGIPELRKVCALGNTFYPVKNDPASSVPFAVFCPDPEPHAFLGGSWYDLLKDTQLINSQLLRGILDSLSVSLFPRPVYVDGQVSVADILNTAIGAPVRERAPNMVRWDAAPFTGEKVMPVMSFMRDVIERRIGQKDGAGSLDMDALQSTGKEAVNAAIVAAQAQSELLARIFCEQTLKPMFRQLGELASHPKSRERIVRLRGNWVPVSPSTWDSNMDVTVNVALGSMDTQKKVGILRDVVADQTAILSTYGPENPVVNIAMLRNAKAKILYLQGIRDVDSYYLPVAPDWQPPPSPPPEPTPDQLWIQAEKEMAFQKYMKELAIKQDELDLKREELAQQRELKLIELEQNYNLKKYEIDQKAVVQTANADMDREVETDIAAVEAMLRKAELDASQESPEPTGVTSE